MQLSTGGAGEDDSHKVLAAQALGSLPSFLPPRMRPDSLVIAVELGAWGALVAALANGLDSTDVEDACVVSLSQLLAPLLAADDDERPDGAEPLRLSAASSAAVRRLAEQLFEDEFLLGQLAAVLASTSNSSRVMLAVARIVTIAVQRQALHPANAHIVSASPLPRALLALVAHPARDHHIRDSAACALASLQMATATPDTFRDSLSMELFGALTSLYRRSIDPGTQSSLVNPADAAALLLKAASMQPWTRFDAMHKGKSSKLLLSSLLEGNTVECLVSYSAIEAGNVRFKVAEAAALAVQVLDAMAPRVAARLLVLASNPPDIGVLFSRLNDRLQRGKLKLQDVLDSYDEGLKGWMNADETLGFMQELVPEAAPCELRALGAMLDVEGAGRLTVDALLQAKRQREAALSQMRGLSSRDVVQALLRLGHRIMAAPAAARDAFDDADRNGEGVLDMRACKLFLTVLMPELTQQDADGVAAYLASLESQGKKQFALWQLMISLHGVEASGRSDAAAQVAPGYEAEAVEERLADIKAELLALKRQIAAVEGRMLEQDQQGADKEGAGKKGGKKRADEDDYSDYDEDVIEEEGEEEDTEEVVRGLWARRHALKREYTELRAQSRALGRLLERLRDGRQLLQDLADKQPSAPRKVKLCPPNLPLLKDALTALATLATPPETANKDVDREQAALTAEVHRRLFAGGVLPACLRLVEGLEGAGKVAHEAAALLVGCLRLPSALLDVLAGCRSELLGMLDALQSASSRVSTRLRRVQDEARKVSKALALGIPRGTHGRYVPLTDQNALSPGVNPDDVAARAMVLADEEAALAMELEALAAASAEVQAYGTELDERVAGLTAGLGKATRGFPDVAAAAEEEGATEEGAAGGSEVVGLLQEVAAAGGPGGGGGAAAAAERPRSARSAGDRGGGGGGGGGRGPPPALPPAAVPPLVEALLSQLGPLATPEPTVLPALEAFLSGASATASPAPGSKYSFAPSVSSASSSASSSWPPPSAPSAATVKAPPSSSMYSQIRFTYSPMRGASTPSNRRAAGGLTTASPSDQPLLGEASAASAEASGQLPAGEDSLYLAPPGGTERVLEDAEALLAAVRGSRMMTPVDSEDGDEGDYAEGTTTASGSAGERAGGSSSGAQARDGSDSSGAARTLLQAFFEQAYKLSELLSSLAQIKGLAVSITRQARLLPTQVSYSNAQVEDVDRYLPDLMALLADAMRRYPQQASSIADTVTDITSQHLILPEERELMYVRSNVTQELMAMLNAKLPAAASPRGAGAASSPRQQPQRPVSARAAAAAGPPVLRPSQGLVRNQTAAAEALLAMAKEDDKVVDAIAADSTSLNTLMSLSGDHSLDWTARASSTALLSRLITGGGPAAEAALASGAFLGLIELMDRDTYPYYRQGGGAKENAIEALKTIATNPELRDMVVDNTPPDEAAAYSLMLAAGDDVLRACLRALWAVCDQLYKLMSSERTAKGKYVDPEMAAPLVATCRAAARGMVEVLAAEPAAEDVMRLMGVRSRMSAAFLQSIKDPALLESLLSIKARLKPRD